jgi:hypothetical protein
VFAAYLLQIEKEQNQRLAADFGCTGPLQPVLTDTSINNR